MFFFVVLCAIAIAIAINQVACETNSNSNSNSVNSTKHHYRSIHLLDELARDLDLGAKESILTETDIGEIGAAKLKIVKLSNELRDEEVKLLVLLNEIDGVKKENGLLWMFDQKVKRNIREKQHQVKQQRAKIASIFDEVNYQWKFIKLHYSITSNVFIGDILQFFPDILLATLENFDFVLDLGIIGFLLIGPIFAFFLWTFAIHFVLSFAVLYISITYLIQLPSLILQYNVTLPEFVAVELALSLTILAIASLVRYL